MTRLVLQVALILGLGLGLGWAQTLHGVTDSLSGGGSPIPPVGCSGTIDLGNGCPQPMLGVM